MNRRFPSFLLCLLGVTSAFACSGNSGSGDSSTPAPVLQTSGQPEELTFASSLGVNLAMMTRTTTGLYYQDLLVGNGEAASPGRRVQVAYAGWLADGLMFDESPSGRPYAFFLGRGQVIPGWDEGVNGMKVGGRRLLVIPPGLAYGRQSPGAGIPPYATLVFDVRLIRVQ